MGHKILRINITIKLPRGVVLGNGFRMAALIYILIMRFDENLHSVSLANRLQVYHFSP